MKLKILSVHGHGDVDKEHVLLRAVEDCDVGLYALADTTFTTGQIISNRLRHFFWFPDKAVKKGEFVSLWTKVGADTVAATAEKVPVHRFFWNLRVPVWNDTGDAAVLLHTPQWQVLRSR